LQVDDLFTKIGILTVEDGYKGKHANQDWDGEIADWDDNDDQQ